ncbi:MFS transporter [Pseudonocardia pini]|uniref:MFS transporter n=1 Tax=Pseudonocardia pini TaxID=2758030 RepID=UPI0028AD49F4|nr:MFS transporter [Pseudonocardia pini]
MDRRLALLVAAAFFMEILDATVIAPAAPHIAADLGVSPVDVNVAVTAYILTVAVLVPVSGWLADRAGPRRVFAAAIVLFTLASVGCALAPNLGVLVGTRVLQGVGGAMMVPVGRLVVLRTTDRSDLVRAIAYLTWPALLAPVLAPALGGLLAEYASWRWIFLVNVPLGIAALVATRSLVPRVPALDPGRLDRTGFLLGASGIAALVGGLELLGTGTPRWFAVGALLVAAAVLLTAAVRHLLRTRRPLVDLRVLGVHTLRTTAGAGSVFRAVITAVPFLLPLFFQLGFGWSAAQAGLVVIALFVGNVGIKPATTPLMRRFGARSVMVASVAASVAMLVAIAFLQAQTPLWLVVAVLVASGIGRSVGFTTYNSIAFADVEPDRMTPANTLVSTLQEVSAGLGVAVGALLVRLGDVVAPDSGTTPYRIAFLALAVLLAPAVVAALRLPRDAAAAVTGHAARS